MMLKKRGPSDPAFGGPVTHITSAMARLSHLDGLRFMAQMWILAAENLFIGWKPLWMRRPDVAVSLFIALSGFCTHWAYAKKMRFRPQPVSLPPSRCSAVVLRLAL